jgi:hypothetical protein
MIWLFLHPLSPLTSASWLSFSVFLFVAGRDYYRAGRGVVGGAKSSDGEKAWSSLNHSILSGCSPVPSFVYTIVLTQMCSDPMQIQKQLYFKTETAGTGPQSLYTRMTRIHSTHYRETEGGNHLGDCSYYESSMT